MVRYVIKRLIIIIPLLLTDMPAPIPASRPSTPVRAERRWPQMAEQMEKKKHRRHADTHGEKHRKGQHERRHGRKPESLKPGSCGPISSTTSYQTRSRPSSWRSPWRWPVRGAARPGQGRGAAVPHRGLPPDPSQEREGCDFYERCPHKCEKCLTYDREMVEIGPGHFSRCWRTEE